VDAFCSETHKGLRINYREGGGGGSKIHRGDQKLN